MKVRDMTARDMTARDMTARDMTAHGSWMHRKPFSLPSLLSTYFSPPFI
jgi:hypothetical protein